MPKTRDIDLNKKDIVNDEKPEIYISLEPENRPELIISKINHTQTISTNSLLFIVIGDVNINDRLEKALPGFTEQIAANTIKRVELENESIKEYNENLSIDSKMSKRGQNFAAAILCAGFICVGTLIYSGAYTQASILGGFLLATPLVNNFIASKWGNRLVVHGDDKEHKIND